MDEPATAASADAAPTPKRRFRLRFPYAHPGAFGALGILCLGLALALLSMPPGPLPVLVLVADVPFLLLLFYRNGERWKRWTFLYGALWFAFTLRWLSEVHPAEVPAAAVVLGPTFLVVGALIRLAARTRAPFVLSVGLLIVFEEMLRTFWMGGMPWPMRSLAFTGDSGFWPLPGSLVPGAGLFGAYALTFIAATTSALVWGLPRWWRAPDDVRKGMGRALLLGLVWPIGMLVACSVYGAQRQSDYEARIGAKETYVTQKKLVAIQAVIPQDLKNAAVGERILEDHLTLSAAAVGGTRGASVFGLVWPETMVLWPFYSPELAARMPDRWDDGEVGVMRRLRREVLDGRDLHVFLGALYRAREDEHVYENPSRYGERDSLFHVRPLHAPDGEAPPSDRPDPTNPDWFPPWGQPHGRHDKVQLVPGGEYMPLGDWLPFLKELRRRMVPIPELVRGAEHQAPFEVALGPPWTEGPRPPEARIVKVGTIICFDLAFPARCRTWRRDGAEVLLNAANYGWFGQTDFRAQVLAMARLRAAESNTTIVMAGNTGPTGFFDPLGRSMGAFLAWDPETGVAPAVAAGGLETTFQPGWAESRVVADPYRPPYVRWGDAPWALAALLTVLWTLVRYRLRGRSHVG